MKHKRFNVEQIVAVLKQAEAGVPLVELIRRMGISEQTFYRWKKQYVGLEVDQVRQLKQLQEENPSARRTRIRLPADLHHWLCFCFSATSPFILEGGDQEGTFMLAVGLQGG